MALGARADVSSRVTCTHRQRNSFSMVGLKKASVPTSPTALSSPVGTEAWNYTIRSSFLWLGIQMSQRGDDLCTITAVAGPQRHPPYVSGRVSGPLLTFPGTASPLPAVTRGCALCSVWLASCEVSCALRKRGAGGAPFHLLWRVFH